MLPVLGGDIILLRDMILSVCHSLSFLKPRKSFSILSLLNICFERGLKCVLFLSTKIFCVFFFLLGFCYCRISIFKHQMYLGSLGKCWVTLHIANIVLNKYSDLGEMVTSVCREWECAACLFSLRWVLVFRFCWSHGDEKWQWKCSGS